MHTNRPKCKTTAGRQVNADIEQDTEKNADTEKDIKRTQRSRCGHTQRQRIQQTKMEADGKMNTQIGGQKDEQINMHAISAETMTTTTGLKTRIGR